jgi:hypothetical protein
MTSKDLIEQSLNEANQTRVNVERKFIALHWDKLNRKPTTNSWSAAECFQHLLFTNSGYLKHFNEVVSSSQEVNEFNSFNHSSILRKESIGHPFKHSFWGKLIMYFVNPKTKMKSKTTKPFNPTYSKVETDVIQKYLFQHDQLFRIVSEMKNLDLRKLKIPSPINARIKYNLGDAIRIIILHDQRHIQQAIKAVNQ